MTRHRHLESHFQNALNLRTRIDIGVKGLVVVLVFLTKIHASRQFANHHEVGTTQQFLFQRRLVEQTIKRGYRTDIGKESQFLTHSQQARFRAHLQRRIVVVFQVTNSSKEYCISTHTDIVGTVRIGIATSINGTGAN